MYLHTDTYFVKNYDTGMPNWRGVLKGFCDDICEINLLRRRRHLQLAFSVIYVRTCLWCLVYICHGRRVKTLFMHRRWLRATSYVFTLYTLGDARPICLRDTRYDQMSLHKCHQNTGGNRYLPFIDHLLEELQTRLP